MLRAVSKLLRTLTWEFWSNGCILRCCHAMLQGNCALPLSNSGRTDAWTLEHPFTAEALQCLKHGKLYQRWRISHARCSLSAFVSLPRTLNVTANIILLDIRTWSKELQKFHIAAGGCLGHSRANKPSPHARMRLGQGVPMSPSKWMCTKFESAKTLVGGSDNPSKRGGLPPFRSIYIRCESPKALRGGSDNPFQRGGLPPFHSYRYWVPKRQHPSWTGQSF